MEVAPPLQRLQSCLSVVDNISEYAGKLLRWLILALIFMLCWEVLLRSVFNAPTLWVHEGSQYVFGVYFALGGAYALKLGSMVNVDIFIKRLKPRTQAVVNAVTGIATIIFILVLICKGFDIALVSVRILETSNTIWGPPIYPLKITVVLGALLLGMQSLAKSIRDIIFGISGKAFA